MRIRDNCVHLMNNAKIMSLGYLTLIAIPTSSALVV